MYIQAETIQPAHLKDQIVLVERINRQMCANHAVPRDIDILALLRNRPDVITGHDITGARDRIINAKTKDPFVEHFNKLDSLTALSNNWDSEGADAPNKQSLFFGRKVLESFLHEGLLPTNVAPSVEGGVGFYFISGNKYADIECLNSGEILAVTSDRVKPADVWEISSETDIEEAIKKIRTFLNG